MYTLTVETSLYLFRFLPQLQNQELQKSFHNVLVFLGQSQSHSVSIDVEGTNIH